MDTEKPTGVVDSINPINSQISDTTENQDATEATKQSTKKPKITALILVAVTVMLLGAGAAAYTKFVVNSPDNIWESAMQNTQVGYSQLSELATAEPAKGGKLEGSFDLTSPVGAGGTMKGGWYENNSEFIGELDVLGVKVKAEVRTISSVGASNPDIYMRVDGLVDALPLIQSLQPGLEPIFRTINGNWYTIDSTTLTSVLPATGSDTTAMMTPEQISDVSTKLGTVLQERLFTVDSSKAVVVVKNPVGREEFDGHDSYKYDVTVQKSQYDEFVKALKDIIKDTPLQGALEQSTSGSGSDLMDIDKLAPEIDASSSTYNVEVWVDMDLRYFRNVRITAVETDGKSQGYIDFGLDYHGGDSFPFSIGIISTATEGSPDTIKAILNATINKADKSIDFGFDISGSVDNQKIAATGKLLYRPSNDQIQVEKPENAKSITEFLAQLGGAGSSNLEQGVLDNFGGDSNPLNAVEL